MFLESDGDLAGGSIVKFVNISAPSSFRLAQPPTNVRGVSGDRRKMLVWGEGSSAGGSIVKSLNISARPLFRLLGPPYDVRVKRGRLGRRVHS